MNEVIAAAIWEAWSEGKPAPEILQESRRFLSAAEFQLARQLLQTWEIQRALERLEKPPVDREALLVGLFQSWEGGVSVDVILAECKKHLNRADLDFAFQALEYLAKNQPKTSYEQANGKISPQLPDPATVPTVKPPLPAPGAYQPEKLFDWQLFNTRPERYAHLALLGETGGGKSVTAEWLASWLSGDTFVIAPHRKPGEWQNLKTFCGGRNYGSFDDEAPDWKDIHSGRQPKVSAAAFLKSLVEEMDQRYQLRDQGNSEDAPVINVIVDEALAVLDKVPKLGELIITLLQEARKVGIRLILLIHGEEVKALKIEGRGSVRQCLKYVRLSDFAPSHARKLGNEDLAVWMEGLLLTGKEYPALIENQPAVIPNLSQFSSSPAVHPPFTDSVNPISELSGERIQGSDYSQVNLGELQPTFDPFTPEIDPLERGKIITLRREGKSLEHIVHALYQVRKGKSSKYIAGLEKVKLVLKEIGGNDYES